MTGNSYRSALAQYDALLSTSTIRRSIAFSPNGDEIAFICDKSGSPNVWLVSLLDQAFRQVTNFAEDAPDVVAWLPGGSFLLLADKNGNGYYRMAKLSGNDLAWLTDSRCICDFNGRSTTEDGAKAFFSSNQRSRKEYDVCSIDSATGASEIIVADGYVNKVTACSPSGRYVAYQQIRNNAEKTPHIIDTLTNEVMAIGANMIGDGAINSWAPDEQSCFLTTNAESEFATAYRYDLNSGEIRPIFARRHDVEFCLALDNGRSLISCNEAGYSRLYIRRDEVVMQIPFIDCEIRGVSINPRAQRVAFTLREPNRPMEVWVGDGLWA